MKTLIILLALFITGCATFGQQARTHDQVSPAPGTHDQVSPAPGTHDQVSPAPPTHAEMMCAANPFKCEGLTPNRAQPRTHAEMMCAANPFNC